MISAGLLFIYRPWSKDFEQNVEFGVIGLNKLECDLFIMALTTIPYIYIICFLDNAPLQHF